MCTLIIFFFNLSSNNNSIYKLYITSGSLILRHVFLLDLRLELEFSHEQAIIEFIVGNKVFCYTLFPEIIDALFKNKIGL